LECLGTPTLSSNSNAQQEVGRNGQLVGVSTAVMHELSGAFRLDSSCFAQTVADCEAFANTFFDFSRQAMDLFQLYLDLKGKRMTKLMTVKTAQKWFGS